MGGPITGNRQNLRPKSVEMAGATAIARRPAVQKGSVSPAADRHHAASVFFRITIIVISLIAQQASGGISEKESKVQPDAYQIAGDRKGRVTVIKAVSGHVIRTFQMKEGVVREVFLLEGGNTVGASQKDHTVFWDLATGREIGRVGKRVYGFSRDETRFFAYDEEGVFLYSYPSLEHICRLAKGPMIGPESFLFSPDDRFLAILFASGRPASDQHYPASPPVRRGIRYARLFSIETCREVKDFSQLGVVQLGEFSEDSRFYHLKDAGITIEGERFMGSWRFDLTTHHVKKVPESTRHVSAKEEQK